MAVFAFGSRDQFWEFPDTKPPLEYGSVTISRTTASGEVSPVTFSHWKHRIKYSCRVCHFELEFRYEANTTEITEEDNRNGLFCGACHNGVRAFGHTVENCARCHNQEPQRPDNRFNKLAERLPSEYGNKIDWVRAINITRPRFSIFDEHEKPMSFNKGLSLQAEWPRIPPAVFPHSVHKRLIDCSGCHPDIFNIKKKTTKHFRMEYILDGKFCGVCHLKIAFPMNYCKGCHPSIKEK